MSKSNGVDVIDGGGPEGEQKKNCFLVTPIGEDNGPVRKRSDLVRTYIIEEALGPLGYAISRSDLVDASGDITEQIVSQLLSADLVVADLTDHNPNVFYELALRHAFSKPFIHIAQKGERLPFDIAQQRTVFYDLTDLPSVYAAKASIRSAAEEILAGGDSYKVVSPVTRAVDFDSLRRSEDPEQVAIADIKQSVSDIQTVLMRMATRGPDRLEPPSYRIFEGIFRQQIREGRFTADDFEMLLEAFGTRDAFSPLIKNIKRYFISATESAREAQNSGEDAESQLSTELRNVRASFGAEGMDPPTPRFRHVRPNDE